MIDPERYWLALDTSSSLGSVALGRGGRLVAEMAIGVRGGHSSALLPAIDRVLHSVGATPSELERVIVGSGPGSFTGLRIAAATAKGIAHALGTPLYAYSSLLTTAAQAWSAAGPVCALFDARGRDLFAACYRFTPEGVQVAIAPCVLTLDALLERWRGQEPPLFLGGGVERHRLEFESAFPASALAPHTFGAPRAATLLWLAEREPEGRVVDPFTWEPEYLRASGAERIAAARAAQESAP